MANSACARRSSSSGSGRPSASSARVEQDGERGIVEPAQHQHLAARQQRGVELERRVLGRGADQRDRAVLDVRQEAVLLGAVEAMDLVDEQQRALAVLAALRGPPRRSCADRRRRRTPPTAARNAGRSPRPAAARSWSCRSRAAPTGSARTASSPPACGRAALRGRADDPGPGCRRSPCGRSRSASGVGASEAKSSAMRLYARSRTRRWNWTVWTMPSRAKAMLLTPVAMRSLELGRRVLTSLAVDADHHVAAPQEAARRRSRPATSTTATPARHSISPISSATAGERLTTVAPISGWRPSSTDRSRGGSSGGAISGNCEGHLLAAADHA